MTSESAAKLLPLCWIAGTLAALQITQLPPPWIIFGLLVIGPAALLHRRTRVISMFLLATAWTWWHCQQLIEPRILTSEIIEVTGKIDGLPEVLDDYTRFTFAPDRSDGDSTTLPGRLQVHWYRERPELKSGQSWRLTLAVKPPRGRVNFAGRDFEQWLFSRRTAGLATVRTGELVSGGRLAESGIDSMREHIRDRIAVASPDTDAVGVMTALAIADKSKLSGDLRNLLISTGTAHLLAVSGLHIGLAAGLGTVFFRALIGVISRGFLGRINMQISLLAGFLTATAYSALAGWGVSTRRALVMAAVVMLTLMLSRKIRPAQSVLLAMVIVLMLNPLAPLGSGFWLSFLAVSALVAMFSPRRGSVHWLAGLVLAQLAVMAVMAPAGLAWFQVFSPVGLLANLVAIPVVSLLVVPPVLLGAFSAHWPVLSELCFQFSAQVIGYLLAVLSLLSDWQGVLPVRPMPGTTSLVLATLGGFLLLLPRGMSVRWAGLFLLAPLFMPVEPNRTRDTLRLDVLDVGQGTAVLILTPNHSLLYDTGPGDGQRRDLVRSTILPALRAAGLDSPDRILVSHADLDHAGGVRSLQSYSPGSEWIGHAVDPSDELLNQSMTPCHAGMAWTWDGLMFRVLHPSPGLPYLGNDSSCVLSITGRDVSLLLPGDISALVERRLVREGLESHRVVLVPHHGSLTSSSPAFIAATQPEWAIATAGAGNRFRFPRKEIRNRYLDGNARFLSTSSCGAVRLWFERTGDITLETARRRRDRLWRWPAAEECP